MDYSFVEDRLDRADVNFRIADFDQLTTQYWARKGYDHMNEALEEVECEESYEEFEEEVLEGNYDDALNIL